MVSQLNVAAKVVYGCW